MPPIPPPTGLDLALLRAVPPAAARVLVVGPTGESLRSALAAGPLHRQVLETGQGVDATGPFVRDGPVDAILYPTFQALPDPESALRQHRRLLAPGGVIVAAVPNARHHSHLLALVRGVSTGGGCSRPRLFVLAAAQALFLDAGYAPDLAGVVSEPAPAGTLAALAAALGGNGAVGPRHRFEFNTAAFVLRGHPLACADARPAREIDRLTFVTCVSDEAVLRANLLASPDLGPDGPHEVILVHNCPAAADGLNLGLARARNGLVVGVHQDVYLPRGWATRFADEWRRAERALGAVAVAGVYGVAGRGRGGRRVGHVVDRTRLLREPDPLPALADSLDELLLAVRVDSGVRFDPALGFHLHGTDICLAAGRRGLAAAVVDAPCLHNSQGTGLPAGFGSSVAVLAAKWSDRLPLTTPCVQIDSDGRHAEW